MQVLAVLNFFYGIIALEFHNRITLRVQIIFRSLFVTIKLKTGCFFNVFTNINIPSKKM